MSCNTISQLCVTKSRIQALTRSILDRLASVLFDNKEHIATFTLICRSVKSTQKHYSTFPRISWQMRFGESSYSDLKYCHLSFLSYFSSGVALVVLSNFSSEKNNRWLNHLHSQPNTKVTTTVELPPAAMKVANRFASVTSLPEEQSRIPEHLRQAVLCFRAPKVPTFTL